MRALPIIAAAALALPGAALAGTTPEPPPPVPTPPAPEAPTPEAPTPPAEQQPANPVQSPARESTPQPSGPPVIAIDPGHGGGDPGAIGILPRGTLTGLKQRTDGRGRNLLLEKDVNLDVARRLRRWLQRRGYRTVMTRTKDRAGGDRPFTTVRNDLQARVDIANQAAASLFVSIHMNSARSGAARGAETYRFTVSGPAAAGLAGAVQDRLITRTGLPSRGVKRAGFFVLKHTVMPAVLVEGGFLSNAVDARLLATNAFRARVAAGIGEGVDTYVSEGGSLGAPGRRALQIKYWVHAGQFRKRALVLKRVAKLRRSGFDALVRRRYSKRANRVMFFAVAGQFAYVDNAKRLRAEMRAERLPAIITSAG
jgi:N-acetylmuramoyl-L-alanine amidase